MDMAALFGEISVGLSASFGGPYFAGRILSETAPQTDAGGSIIPGQANNRDCMVQVETSEAMLRALGYADGEVQFMILTSSLDGGLDSDARVRVLAGPNQGLWLVSQLAKDSFGAYWAGRGQRG